LLITVFEFITGSGQSPSHYLGASTKKL